MIPVVSVLMPVKNEGKFVGSALRSVQKQTLSAWELVVVDDGSTDDTPDIVKRLAAHDERISLLPNSGRGLVSALNCGLAACRGELVARMDGDDICHPRRLERQLGFLTENPEVGLVACNFRHFPRRHLKVGMLSYETWQNGLLSHEQIMNDRYVESPFVHPTVMFRRREVLKVGGYRDRGWAEDYDLWLRLAQGGVRFASLAEVLFYWRDRQDRATRSMEEYSSAAFRRCKAHHLQKGFLHGVSSVTLIGAGLEGRAWRRVLVEVGVTVTRWVDLDPRKIGRELHGATVVTVDKLVPGSGPMLVTIGTRGARDQVRLSAAMRGLVEGKDYICVT